MLSSAMIRFICIAGALSFTGDPVLGCEASWLDCNLSACYHFHMCYKPFNEAKDICNNSGTMLASITSLQERSYLANAIRTGLLAYGRSDNTFLVGGVRTTTIGDFTWLDESAFIFQGEITGNGQCLKFEGLPDDILTATACNNYNQFLCKNGTATPLVDSLLSSGFSTVGNSDSSTAHELFTSSTHFNSRLSSLLDTSLYGSIDTESAMESHVSSMYVTSSSNTILSTGTSSHLLTQFTTILSDIKTTRFPTVIETNEISSGYDPTVFQTKGEIIPLKEDLPSVDVSRSDYVNPASTMGLASLVSVLRETAVFTEVTVQIPSSLAPEIPVPTVTSVESVYPFRTNYCICGCKGSVLTLLNTTNPDVQLFLDTKFKKKKLTTADDPRPSARGIGGGAVALLVVGFVLIVVMDASKLVKDLSMMYDNIRGREPCSRSKQKRRA